MGRRVRRTPAFRRSLRRLARQHRDLPATVTDALRRYVDQGVESRYRQKGVGGLPVFKERLPLRKSGKRGGARLIVYCDPQWVVALFVYTKAGTDVIPGGEIRKALKDAGLGAIPTEVHGFETGNPI